MPQGGSLNAFPRSLQYDLSCSVHCQMMLKGSGMTAISFADWGAIADRPDSSREERLQHRFLIATGLVMSGGGLLWGTVASGMGLYLQSLVPFGYVVLTAINFGALWRTKNFKLARAFQIFISILLPFVFQWSLGGLVASGGTMLWSMLCLTAAQSFGGRTMSRLWLGFFVLLVFVSLIIEINNPPPLHLFQDAELIKIPLYLFTMNFLAVSLAIFVLVSFFMRLRRQMGQALERRNTALAQSREALVQSEKMAAVGELVAGVAHELNTPLGAIRASNDNLSRAIKNILTGWPELNDASNKQELAGVTSLMRVIETSEGEMTTREERQIRKSLAIKLADLGFQDATQKSSELVEIGLRDIDLDQASVLRSNRWPLVFAQLRSFASLNRNCNTIKMAAERSSKIVFALKNYAHPGTKGEFTNGSVAENLDTVLTLYQNLIKRGVRVITRYDVDTVMSADHDALNQVWTNLIHNALQAMDYDGTLTLEARMNSEELIVSVEDTGSGISPDRIDRIYEPFYTTKEIGEGTGLGLSISIDIVRRHGGTMTVNSTPGQTEFTVRIPRVQKQEQEELTNG